MSDYDEVRDVPRERRWPRATATAALAVGVLWPLVAHLRFGLPWLSVLLEEVAVALVAGMITVITSAVNALPAHLASTSTEVAAAPLDERRHATPPETGYLETRTRAEEYGDVDWEAAARTFDSEDLADAYDRPVERNDDTAEEAS